jgi:pantoate--beta-alanine ligase
MKSPWIWNTVEESQRECAALLRQGGRIGVVPTMGALHAGHLSLVRASKDRCEYTVVTIFVNPTQFGPNEDLSRYPRTFEQDLALLAELEVDAVFAPSIEEMYGNATTMVQPPSIAEPLEGQHRPGHFQGVATIVLKLFHAVPANEAFFGQKDFQQALVIQQMVADLNHPIHVHVLPIVREADGLAMSSRNRYLSTTDRERALALRRTLQDAKKWIAEGERDGVKISCWMQESLAPHIDALDYALLADPTTLTPVSEIRSATAALIAVYIGETRLIDNEVIDFPDC